MSNILLASMLQDAFDERHPGGSYMNRYLHNLDCCREYFGERFYAVSFDGDSTDDTAKCLLESASSRPWMSVVSRDYGHTKFASTVLIPQRWEQLSRCWNDNFDWINRQPFGDVIVYCEADLIYEAADIEALERRLGDGVDACSPWIVVATPNGDIFYDKWGYRSNKINFTNGPPYHPMLVESRDLYPLDSAGAMIVMKRKVAERHRFDSREMITKSYFSPKGFELWLDPKVRIRHPA